MDSVITFLRAYCFLGALLFVFPLHAAEEKTQSATATLSQAESLHDIWSTLLGKYVVSINNGHSTAVNYAGFAFERDLLKTYLQRLESVSVKEFSHWGKHRQLAFLINAYNAHTVELILEYYPDLESIRDIGGFFSSPWKKKVARLLEQTRSLDNIEHQLIRGANKYEEPRIHFAVNCASVGCPALREEAYTAENLEQQLADQTRRFLSDQSRNRLEQDELVVSKIFDWYRDDFEFGWRGLDDLPAFLAHYSSILELTEAQRLQVLSGEIRISFMDYDWSLNDEH